MWIGFHVSSTHYSCQILTRLEFLWQIFEKYSNIKFHENLSAKLLHADGQTSRRADRRTDMTKLTVVFRNFAKAQKKNKNKQGTGLSFCAHTKVSA